MRLSIKNIIYNNIIQQINKVEHIKLNKRVRTNLGSLKGLITNGVFHYGIISEVGKKDKRVNLRLFNTQSLEAIEQAIKEQI